MRDTFIVYRMFVIFHNNVVRTRNHGGSSISQFEDNGCTLSFVHDNQSSLGSGGQFHNFTKDGGVHVKKKRCKDGNGVGIVSKRHGDSVNEERNQNSASSALENHSHEFVRHRLFFLQSFEEFASCWNDEKIFGVSSCLCILPSEIEFIQRTTDIVVP